MLGIRHFSSSRPRGSIAAYMMALLVLFSAILTLAVDYGRAQMVKSQMQKLADAVSRGYVNYYIIGGQSYADSMGPSLYGRSVNPVDAGSGISPTVAIAWGYWTPATNTFNPGSGTVPAVKVTVSRTRGNGNALPVSWGGLVGISSTDIKVTSIAARMGGQSASLSIPPTANLYLSGMPSGTTTADGFDNTSSATPYQTSIPVVPGTWVSFSSLAGTSSVLPGYIGYTGPSGNSTYPTHHGQNWNGYYYHVGPENGIADAVMYEDAVCGMFLTNSAPTSGFTPPTVDWTQGNVADQATNSNLNVQQPFMIGTGQTSGGATKQFLVPPGATRLFISIWDGVNYSNNSTTPVTGNANISYYVQLSQ